MSIKVNEKIIRYLRDNEIKMAELARKTGMGQSNLNKLLNGEGMRISHLAEITKALGLPITYFFDGKEHISNEELTHSEEGKTAELERLKDEILFLKSEINDRKAHIRDLEKDKNTWKDLYLNLTKKK